MKENRRFKLLPVLALAATALLSASAPAQARETAEKSADISVFGGISGVKTDYFNTNQAGFVLGADYTRFFRKLYVDPALELRASITPKGDYVGESTYSGGIRLGHQYKRFYPYGDFLVGAGYVHFGGTPDRSDNSIVYTYGGGLDFDLIRNFGAKVDFQGSRWHPGENDFRYPTILSIGVTYHVPLHFRFKND